MVESYQGVFQEDEPDFIHTCLLAEVEVLTDSGLAGKAVIVRPLDALREAWKTPILG